MDRKTFFKAIARKQEQLTLDGGTVTVREMSALEYNEVFTSQLVNGPDGKLDGGRFSGLLAVRCLCDQQGNRILADEDLDQFLAGSTTTCLAIVRAVKRVNGIDIEASAGN